jgi:hypothetical protein
MYVDIVFMLKVFIKPFENNKPGLANTCTLEKHKIKILF